MHLQYNDWELYQHFGQSFAGFVFKTLPYFWLLIFGVFGAFAYYSFRHTKKGYRYSFVLVVLGCLVASFALGFGLQRVGVAERTERFIYERFPAYEKIVSLREMRWARPEDGVLAGEIWGRIEGGFALEDLKGNSWKVMARPEVMDPRLKIRRGMQVRIIGEKIDQGLFEAEKVLPWMGPQKKLKEKSMRLRTR